MDDKTSRVDRFICTSDSVSLLVYSDHIRDLEEGKVYTVRIDPERAGFDGV
jgi:hypothetical protein